MLSSDFTSLYVLTFSDSDCETLTDGGGYVWRGVASGTAVHRGRGGG